MKQQPNFVLLQRKGQILIVQAYGASQPSAIHHIDILLLSKCMAHKDDDAVCSAFISHPWIQKTAPQLRTDAVRERISQLKFRDVLKTHSSSSTVSCLTRCNSAALSLPEHLRVTSNLAIEIAQDGFIVWSARLNQAFSIPLDAIVLLMSFADGKTINEVYGKKFDLFDSVEQIEALVAKLFYVGLLVEAHPAKEQQQTLVPYFENQVDSEHKSLSWKDLQPDGRIPVYFVPHMENHFPLALGVLFSALKNYKEGELLKRFQLIPIHFLEPAELLSGPYRKFGAGVWLFSNYMWSVELNLEISEAVKKHNKANITIHGGPSTPDYKVACQDFMQQHRSIDIAVHGEGEVAICEIVNAIVHQEGSGFAFDDFLLSAVTGISFRTAISGNIVQTSSRERMRELDVIPSPYLSGYFDQYGGRVEAAIIESNRGCPYGCTFCDWGSATNQKVRKFDLERVYDELEWIGKNRIRVLWIADANFGMYERDIDISKHIVAIKAKYGFPQEVVVNYTKNSTLKLVEIIKIFTEGNIISQGIISIQTTDETTLDVINRKNIRTERYDELSKIFSDLRLPLSTDLMIGLPGITVEAFAKDLQRYIDMDVSVKAYPTQLLPNSPMADPEYIKKYDIKVDANNYLVSSYSYSEQDLALMKEIYQVYVMADGYSLLRYVMRYLQWEHGIKSIEFIQSLLRAVTEDALTYPQLTWAVKFFNQEKCMPGGWHKFYVELQQFITGNYGIEADSALHTVMLVSKLSMPEDSLKYPLHAELPHDFVSYFQNFRNDARPLSDYPPAQFQVSDPNSMTSVNMDYMQYDTHQFFWELASDISRPKSVSDFS